MVSFIGFAPVDDPQVLIYVVIDEPNVEDQASSIYPQYVAQAILSELLPYPSFGRSIPVRLPKLKVLCAFRKFSTPIFAPICIMASLQEFAITSARVSIPCP